MGTAGVQADVHDFEIMPIPEAKIESIAYDSDPDSRLGHPRLPLATILVALANTRSQAPSCLLAASSSRKSLSRAPSDEQTFGCVPGEGSDFSSINEWVRPGPGHARGTQYTSRHLILDDCDFSCLRHRRSSRTRSGRALGACPGLRQWPPSSRPCPAELAQLCPATIDVSGRCQGAGHRGGVPPVCVDHLRQR